MVLGDGGYTEHGSVGVEDQREGLFVFDQAKAEHIFIEDTRFHQIRYGRKSYQLCLFPEIDSWGILHLLGEFSRAVQLFCTRNS